VTKQELGQTEFQLERWAAQPFDTDRIWQWSFSFALRISPSLLRMSFSMTANFRSLRGFFVVNENHILFFDDCWVIFSGRMVIFLKSSQINGEKPFLELTEKSLITNDGLF
jgi:hypothetical protein